MHARYLSHPFAWISTMFAVGLLPAALAQQAPPPITSSQTEPAVLEKFVVTGSMIKRIQGEGALPMQTFSIEQMEQQGIVSPEQLIMQLNINGNGLDNLASNADVVSGAARGNNGATAANLRGQGANATLVLLNGRRIAAHGLNGGVVDLNSIPFAAIERVEILKDGASAIYGTDAIGGVINFILRTNYQGLSASAATDITEDGGGNIHRGSLLAGYGDLNRDKFNLMASFSVVESKALRGDQRDFVNTFQPDRGLSPDTRGTPIATIFPLSSLYTGISRDSTATGRGMGPQDPPVSVITNLNGGINIVDLPGGPGYAGLDGMGPYDELLWSAPAAKYASAWDTGRAAVLQQPVRNTNLVTRGTVKFGRHRLIGEAVIGRSESTKSFSANQITSSTTTNITLPNGTSVANPFYNLAYPGTGPDYNRVFNALVAYFPAIEPNRGQPLAFRWRATPAGNREIKTRSDTERFLLAAEGPLPFLSDWEYRVGASRAESDSSSKLVKGYFYQQAFADLINTGVLNPFSYTQTPAAMEALARVGANGVKLYGGTFTTDEIDATASGSLFKLPKGTVMAAVGLDYREEKYKFAGDLRPNASTLAGVVFNAPFDNALATAGTLKRDVKAAFVELQAPIWTGLDFNVAVRTDEYTGFGRTTNPKFTLRYAPSEKFLVRASYSTGFRVPTFKQMFDPITETTYSGSDFADPANGSSVVTATNPSIRPLIISGGKSDLNPEEAKMASAGFVVQPTRHVSLSVDYWDINRTDSVQTFGLTTLAQNYGLFNDRFLRNSTGTLVAVDSRFVNEGEASTKGLDFALRGDVDAAGGKFSGGFDLTYLLEKKSRLISNAPFGISEIGRFTRNSDIGIRWKHTAYVSYRRGNWSAMINETFRDGYLDQVLPGVANGTVKPVNFQPKVKAYDIYGLSVTYKGIKNLTVIAGVKNLFNTDPPFSVAYDSNSGAGSSWEPRVADPRGRSYTLRVDYNFF